MAVSIEDLENLYNSYSDEEIKRLYKSGNLTEVAKKVALNEIKLRRLTSLTVFQGLLKVMFKVSSFNV